MNLISIDLELNKPSNKIIQLGYIIANVKNKKIQKVSRIYIDPKEDLDPFISELTGIRQEMVNNNVTLEYAYNEMLKDMEKYQVTKHPIQWGLDHYELRKQLKLEWKDYVFRARGHDIKSLYQMYQMRSPNSKTVSGLKTSIENMGNEWDGTYGKQHDALADAYNTLLTYFRLSDKMLKYDMIEKVVK